MKRPKITDVRANKYIDYLEAKLEGFSDKGSQKVNSYKSLLNFITQGNKLLASYKVSDDASELADKDDKALERGIKFSEKLESLQTLLDKLYHEIGELPEEKGKAKAGSAYEQAMRESKGK